MESTPTPRIDDKPVRPAVQTCEWCGTTLGPPPRPNLQKRHCSDRCRYAHRRERERQAIRKLYAALDELKAVFAYLRRGDNG